MSIIINKTISDLKYGDVFTDEYQTKSHARIFIAHSELMCHKKLEYVMVAYKDPCDGKLYEAMYSLNWKVWIYEQ